MNTVLLSKTKKLIGLLLFGACSLSSVAQQDSLRHSVGISYEQTHFTKQFSEDWRVTSAEYSHKVKRATLIGKLNAAQRFGRQGLQFEAQAYPRLSRSVYAFVGASYSNHNPVFPAYTSGVTIYTGLPKGWEVEGGYRQLHFTENIWVGSGGVSKYLGNWLFNFTSYVSIKSPAESQSYFVTAKRFFNNPKEMVWLQAGSGISPDERRNIQLSTPNLTSRRLNAGARFFIWKNTLVQLTAGYSRDEYKEKTYGNQWNGAAGLNFLF